MTEYHVTYTIEVDADSPLAAATIVADILESGGGRRGAYDVREHANPDAPVVLIDLEEVAA